MKPSGLCMMVTVAAACAMSKPAGAGAIDEFVITLEQLVSNGVPGPGAGNIEASGNIDRYFFEGTAGTLVYFDEIPGASCALVWTCRRPDNSVMFSSNALCVGDPATMTLTQDGTYTIEATGNSGATGTYSFIVWVVNPVEEFTIDLKEVVSNGNPGPGAGNLEEPGAIDRYLLEITEPNTLVYFDEIPPANCSILWTCRDPSNAPLFSGNALCVGDPGVMNLAATGTYTIEVSSGASAAVGTYSFTIWILNATETFPITLEQIVSNGNPAPGAGNIEEPGAMDAYTVTVDPGTLVYFDELAATSCNLRWRCRAPDATLLFDENALCVGDPGAILLEQGGEYVVEVYGFAGATGTYSFTLLEVNPTQTFAIALEHIVSNGVPRAGAGNIEEAGAVDEYTFSVAPNTVVFFDELGPASCGLSWRCIAPDGSAVFDLDPLCVGDPGVHTLTLGGEYTIRASGPAGATGTYSFVIWQVNPPEDFVIALDQIVGDGAPGPGAGNIEEPGAIDRYTLSLPANSLVCFEELAGPCVLRWSCTDPANDELFDDSALCSISPGKFLVPSAGDYVITVSGTGDGVGTYSMVVHTGRPADITGDCHVDVDDLIAVILGWGPCADPEDCPADTNGNHAVDVDDLIAVILNWG